LAYNSARETQILTRAAAIVPVNVNPSAENAKPHAIKSHSRYLLMRNLLAQIGNFMNSIPNAIASKIDRIIAVSIIYYQRASLNISPLSVRFSLFIRPSFHYLPYVLSVLTFSGKLVPVNLSR